MPKLNPRFVETSSKEVNLKGVTGARKQSQGCNSSLSHSRRGHSAGTILQQRSAFQDLEHSAALYPKYRSASFSFANQPATLNFDAELKGLRLDELTSKRSLNEGFLDGNRNSNSFYGNFKMNNFSSSGKMKMKESVQDAIQPLLRKYEDYSVSPVHWFTSSAPTKLHDRLKDLLTIENIQYTVQSNNSLCYMCEKTIGSAVYSFCIMVSSLLKGCQKHLGDKYLIEVVKKCATEPYTWGKITGDLYNSLKDMVRSQPKLKEVLITDSGPKCGSNRAHLEEDSRFKNVAVDLDSRNSKVSQDSSSKHFLTEEVDLNSCPVKSFIDFYENNTFNDENEILAQMMCELYIKKSKSMGEIKQTVSQENSLNKVLPLMLRGNKRFNLYACLLLEKMGDSGDLKFFQELDVLSIFRELVRIMLYCKVEQDHELLLAALKAARAFSNSIAPRSFDRDLLSKAIKRCVITQYTDISKTASDVAEKFNISLL